MMKLYGTHLSPYTARALLVARVRGQDLEFLPPPRDGKEREDYLRDNLTGKFPFLDHDGFHLSESAVIADYIDAVASGNSLWPADPKERATSALLTRLVENWVIPGVAGIMRDIISGTAPSEANWVLYTDGLRLLEKQRSADDPWLRGNRFGHADAALIPTLFTAVRFDEASQAGSAFARYPSFASYWARVQADPIVADLITQMEVRARALERGENGLAHIPLRLAEAAARYRGSKSAPGARTSQTE